MTTHFTQLFVLLYREGKIDSLAKAVEQARDRMQAAGEGALLAILARADACSSGRIRSGGGEAAQLSPQLRDAANSQIELERTRKTQDFTPALKIFQLRWEKSQSPEDLFALCELKLQAGNAEFVAEHAKELVSSVRTTSALRLATTAAMAVRIGGCALELLQEHANLFPKGQLPSDLRRLRVSCAQALGLLDDARHEAETLVREEATRENLSMLFHVQVQAGHLKGARFPARELVMRRTRQRELLVEVARVMRLEDPIIASEALKQAAEREIALKPSVWL